MKILLVEDHPDLCEWVAKALRQGGYVVDVAHRAERAEHYLRVDVYDGMLLDLSLPDKDGLDVLRFVRQQGLTLPVLIFTARAGLEDRILGLNLGADDYLPKPFELRELEARLKALLRRATAQLPQVEVGALVFDTVSRHARVGGEVLALTPRELGVLEALLARPGRPLSRDALFAKVFSMEQDARPEAIEIYISRLRKKLEGSHTTITTVRGVGYMLQAVSSKTA